MDKTIDYKNKFQGCVYTRLRK